MCSKKQVIANRENAQKSTGPITEEGKKMSSQNATRHGLNSVSIIVNSPKIQENQSEYDLLVAALIDELEPTSTLQRHLVYKIANCHWRYRRLINAETAYINKLTTPAPPPFPAKTELFRYYDQLEIENQDENWFNFRSIPVGEEANILSRYEWRLSRELQHSYKLLRQLQTWENRPAIKKSQNEPISPELHPPQENTPTIYPPYQNESNSSHRFQQFYSPATSGNGKIPRQT